MASYDLCGTADVATYLQKASTDTSQNALMGDLITRASRSILNWTGREFAPAGTAARSWWYYGDEVLSLAPYDFRSGTVQIDTHTSSPSTLTENSDYYLEPLPAPDGVYQHIRFARGWCAYNQREVTITGNWGFSAVPEDVKHACVVTVGIWMRRDVQAFSATFNVDEGRLERPEALPSAVRATLGHYRRPGVA